jgi:hypothetical protein
MRRRQMLVVISLLMLLLVLAGAILFSHYRILRMEKLQAAASK